MENQPSSPPPPSLSPGKRRLFAFVLIGLVLGLGEGAARRMMPENLAIGRRILLGHEEEQQVRMQQTIPQPYLHYIHA